MHRFISFIYCWIQIAVSLGAQPGIEVTYYTPVEDAGGVYAEHRTTYTLLCETEHSFFYKEAGVSQLDLDEQQQRIMLNVSTGKSWVYKDLHLREMTNLVRSVKDKAYLIEEAVPSITWEILAEERSIRGITVRKARGHFRGRDYTAWFAPDIPVAHGPWKLGGLPGLILEAYDDEHLVVFLFHSIHRRETVKLEKPSTMLPVVTLSRFQAINQKEIRQYFQFLNAKMRKEGTDISYQLGEFERWERLD